jgi:hypothetical protein
MKANKAIATWFKMMFWVVVAAGIDWALKNLGVLNLPLWSVPLIASTLKAIATWIATNETAVS